MFIIRFAERRIDQLLSSTILDYAPSSLDSVQFESEWFFLRSFTGRKTITTAPPPPTSHSGSNASVRSPTSPTISQSQSSRKFSSLKPTFASSKRQQGVQLNTLFSNGVSSAQAPSPADLMSFLTALHSFLVMSDINPALITQLWSQVFYWTGCA